MICENLYRSCAHLRPIGGACMDCRIGCGACCVAPSISTPLPGMPGGKPAGVRCPHLTSEHRCALFGLPERPTVCASLRPSPEMCGCDARAAYSGLIRLERATSISAKRRAIER
jgi:hypothetical protein